MPGYAGKILKLDLITKDHSFLNTGDYSGRFLGGRGIAAKIYWDEVKPGTRAFDPENLFIVMTGPVAGFTRFSGCRWVLCGKSAEMEPESFSYANLGGSWGSWLKYAGYDGLVVKGKAERPVYLYLDDQGTIEIRDAAFLWGKTAKETQDILQQKLGKEVRIMSIGPAGESLVTFSTVLASENASGSSGFGAVMGSKYLKAVAVKAASSGRPAAADPAGLQEMAKKVFSMRKANFEDYGHSLPLKIRFTACYGCISGCTRGTYETADGEQYKSFCQSSAVYIGPAMKYYAGKGQEANLLANRLCDTYGLDTAVLAPLILWLDECFKAGILTENETGLPLSKIGSIEFIERLVYIVSMRQGFGDILAEGTLRAAAVVGKGSDKLISKAGIMTRASETKDHDPRMILANAIVFATEPRRAVHLVHAVSLPLNRWINWRKGYKDAFFSTDAIHDIAARFWGSPEAADFTTYSGKALATRNIQNYGYIKESMVVCDLTWPIYPVNPIDKSIGPFTLESQILSAITGLQYTEEELSRTGERIFNLQRAILMREGWGGRKGDHLMDYLFTDPLGPVFYNPESVVPDKDGQPVVRKDCVIDKDSFEKLKDEYYTLRGWDSRSGYQTRSCLDNLELADIAGGLEKQGLLK